MYNGYDFSVLVKAVIILVIAIKVFRCVMGIGQTPNVPHACLFVLKQETWLNSDKWTYLCFSVEQPSVIFILWNKKPLSVFIFILIVMICFQRVFEPLCKIVCVLQLNLTRYLYITDVN